MRLEGARPGEVPARKCARARAHTLSGLGLTKSERTPLAVEQQPRECCVEGAEGLVGLALIEE